MEPVCVCYCGNKKIFPGLLLSALSLAKYTDRPLRVIVLSMDLHELNAAYLPFSENQMRVLDEALKEKNPESRAELVDLTDLYKETLAEGKNGRGPIYTPYTLLRLYLDVLTDVPEKVLYLDIDTMATADIAKLYDTDVSGHEFAAALDYMGRFWINKHYFNAGVLLLNIPRIRETDLFARARKLLNEKRLTMLDQSALNRLGREVLYLPDRFNEQRKIKEDTVVKHFCKGTDFYFIIPVSFNIKQWQRDKVHRRLKIFCFDDLYEKYDRLAEKYDLSE